MQKCWKTLYCTVYNANVSSYLTNSPQVCKVDHWAVAGHIQVGDFTSANQVTSNYIFSFLQNLYSPPSSISIGDIVSPTFSSPGSRIPLKHCISKVGFMLISQFLLRLQDSRLPRCRQNRAKNRNLRKAQFAGCCDRSYRQLLVKGACRDEL